MVENEAKNLQNRRPMISKNLKKSQHRQSLNKRVRDNAMIVAVP
jgi:hypothetical protein